MPIGHHLAKCMWCHREWIVGDCIPCFCSAECEKKSCEWWKSLVTSEEEEADRLREIKENAKRQAALADDARRRGPLLSWEEKVQEIFAHEPR